MKPLELTAYPPLDAVTNRYIEGCRAGGYEPMFHTTPPGLLEARAKRFTDTELAAEYQFSRYFAWVRAGRTKNSPQTDAVWNAYQGTFHRFATLPHYDEVTA